MTATRSMSTIQVRPLMGSYRRAMAQVARIEVTPAAILEHFAELLGCAGIAGEVTAKRLGVDRRNGWDTYLVLVGGMPCCYADGPLDCGCSGSGAASI